jgi:branched-chain amino acid transport system ATP-binding protein
VLKVESIDVAYGEIRALKGVGLEVGQGEIVTILGNNGAGKTTTPQDDFRAPQAEPRHDHARECLARRRAAARDRLARRRHVPEGRRIFNRLTVRENLMMGAYLRSDAGVGGDLERVFGLFPRLAERLTQVAGTLSGGEQQMLAIGRALMAQSAAAVARRTQHGIGPVLVEQIFDTITDINRQGMTILLVEQNAAMALSIAHRGYVLETGSIALAGTAAELSENADVRRAYLGE